MYHFIFLPTSLFPFLSLSLLFNYPFKGIYWEDLFLSFNLNRVFLFSSLRQKTLWPFRARSQGDGGCIPPPPPRKRIRCFTLLTSGVQKEAKDGGGKIFRNFHRNIQKNKLCFKISIWVTRTFFYLKGQKSRKSDVTW